ncbi:MAG: 2-dehydropantoate 2-reductase [Deltaproteobacteria bacterium]|nr:2-dehydropantoate 2-reductase [Deltaproteobacteria bacterium]
MKIAVVGAGAMGSLFGGLLAEAGAEVWLVDIWSEHVDAVNDRGLTIERDGRVRTVRLQATMDPETVGESDLTIVFVKSTQTEAAARTAKALAGRDGLVLTLQNGMGNADRIAREVEPGHVIAGTTSHGATMLGPGSIRHAGSGLTTIGMWHRQNTHKAEQVAAFFSGAGIETDVSADVRSIVWGKLLINVGINAITALTGIKNGQLLDLPATVALSRAAVEEAIAVAEAQQIAVRPDAVEHVLEVARATGANRSSMGQDVDNRRMTEIGAINGVVVEEAERLGLPAPVNRTLTALVETLQANYL